MGNIVAHAYGAGTAGHFYPKNDDYLQNYLKFSYFPFFLLTYSHFKL